MNLVEENLLLRIHLGAYIKTHMADLHTDSNKWLSLPIKERRKRLDLCYRKLKPHLNDILKRIKTKEKDGTILDEKHSFIFNSLRAFIEQSEFLFTLGKNKYKKMGYYPMRAALEICGKLNYYLQSDNLVRNSVVEVEILTESRVWYKYAKKNGDSTTEEISKRLYYKFKSSQSPEIDCAQKDFVSYASANGFPNMNDCLTKGKIPGALALYDMYKSASARIHGSFLATLMGRVADNEGSSYLWYAQIVIFAVSHTLEMSDSIFFGKIQQSTLNVKQEMRDISQK